MPYPMKKKRIKKKKGGQFDHYKTFTLRDGTKFKARDEKDAELYRARVADD